MTTVCPPDQWPALFSDDVMSKFDHALTILSGTSNPPDGGRRGLAYEQAMAEAYRAAAAELNASATTSGTRLSLVLEFAMRDAGDDRARAAEDMIRLRDHRANGPQQ